MEAQNTHILLAPLQRKIHSPLFAHQLKNLPKNNHPFSLVKINNAKAFTSPLSTLNIDQAARLLNQNCKSYYSFILEI